MTKLTLQMLKDMKPGIFASGDNYIDGAMRTWVATRGEIHDWAIYETPSTHGLGFDRQFFLNHIKNWGNKVHDPEAIQRLVKCDEEAFKMYRH